ncbi:erythromycin esterase family protein [Cytophagaceae bacterium DM2B3-1]|uniref:Erythromycin esterase family protein n=1 Tax=Xanthocytophaga flava TaxID=3048013 RepID=A0ABT7CGX6_9BACT|nr:erythromycin esterase family protein [Xanthocytophaga flavus]MDJ1492992.1 erythromycin esterase family protein [Xanthocytophaga flavus]
MLLFVRGKLYLFLSVPVFFIFFPLFAQINLNLEFEPQPLQQELSPFWSLKRKGTYQFDTTVAYSGKGSLLMEIKNQSFPQGLYTEPILAHSFRNKIVTVSIWVKSADFTGYVFFTAYSLSNEPKSSSHVVSRDSIVGSEWKKLQLELPVAAQADRLGFSIGGWGGNSKIWIDHCQISCEGKEYKDVPLAGTEIVSDTTLAFYKPDFSFEDDKKNSRLFKKSQLTSDSTTHKQGRKSLKVIPTQSDNSYLLCVVPLDTLGGKLLSIKGFVKKASISSPSLYITFVSKFTKKPYYRDSWDIYDYKQIPIQPLTSTDIQNEWQAFSAEVSIPENDFLRYASIGLVPSDTSAFWLDEIRILVDGQGVSELIQPPPPTLAETAWLKKAIIPLKSTSPSEPLTDLLSLSEKIGKAKIIGLGENTHGSHETFQMKHRLIRWLVEQKGYNVIAFEADMAASEAVNEYVLNGKSDAQKVLKALGFWTWNVEEILALITWMRQYNVAHPKQMVQFKGFDMQSPWKALASLKEYLPAKDTLTWHSLKKRMERVVAIRRFVPATDTSIVAALQALREVKTTFLIRVAKHSLSQKAVIEQYFRQIEQVIELRLVGEANRFRDACMAENLYRTFTSIPDARILVWAHNNHVAKLGMDTPMGYWLKSQLGDSYQSIGFTFDQGTFRGIYKDSLQAATAQTSVAGSFESYFKTAQVPLFYLPLQKVPLVKENQWLHQRLLFRDVGAESFNDDFTRHSLLTEFDGLLFLQQSTPSRAVKNSSK